MPRDTMALRSQAWGGCLVCGAKADAAPRMLIARIGSRHTMWLCGDCAEVPANRQQFIDRYAAIWGLPAGQDEAAPAGHTKGEGDRHPPR